MRVLQGDGVPGYPEVALLGVVDDVVPDAVAELEQLLAQLLQARKWAGTPPEFVDSLGSAGVRTCGVCLWLTDVRAPEVTTASAESDRRELADAKAVVAVLSGFSGRTGLTVGIG